MLTDFYAPTIIPVLLLALAGWLILRGEVNHAGRRFLLFLLGAGVFLLLVIFLLFPGYDEPYNQFTFELPIIVMPALIGILVLIVLYLKWFREMDTRAKVTAFLLMVAIVILLGLLRNSRLAVSMILPGALILFLIWSLGWRFGWMPEVLGLIALGALLFFSQTVGIRTTLPMWVTIPFGVLYILSPVFLVVVLALFLTRGLQHLSTAGQDASKKLSRDRWIFRILLALLMFAALTYTAFWGGIWDQTVDLGLGGFMISPLGSVAAIVAGLVMTLTLRGKYRLAGLLYIILVPSLLLRTYDAAMNISHHALTEKRAEQIAQVLERFHAREGYFPESLDVLTPRELLYIPQPIIMVGEKWCYRGAHDFYQLAAIYREYWSLPLSLRIYASAGEPPAETWACEERLAELKAQHDPPPFAGIPETAPTPVPLPTSVVAAPRMSVQPIVRARAISVGKWSPDGMYLVFGVLEVSGDRSVMGLSFLKADTGEVCPVDAQWETGFDDGLREHFAWLPDGRLLYVPSSGDMTLLRPCEAVTLKLTGSHPATFTHALDYHEPSGRVLLKNQTSFWILDGDSLEAIQIPNVNPNPFEAHWDHFNFSPDGNRLAISRLNGRTAREGSTLFIMNAATGEVEHELPLDIASDQSAPMVEWMTEEELLLHGNNALFIIDFRTAPPKFTDVLRDIFLLDISYPNDISSFAWEGQHLSVRVNHPRNQGIYIFHPETGQVEIIQPKSASPLLFFPNGEMVEMANYISDPPAEDAYELIWVDAPDIASQIITVQGHLPRNYPNLFPRYLPDTSQLAFSSSQGVSLISIPGGETLGFWELAGGGGYSSYIVPPSAYPVLVVVADGDGLYYIPLP